MPVPGAGVARFITGHEETQLKRFCYFHFFGVILASKGSNYSESMSNAIKSLCLSWLLAGLIKLR